MYNASVPVFRRYLRNLRALVSLAATHPDAETLLHARLAPNMNDFATQVEIAANFGVRCCGPLAGKPERSGGPFDASFSGLRARIDDVLAFLDALTPGDFDGAHERIIDDRAGAADLALPGQQFLCEYALPNFFFHLSTAYAILRQAGLPIGKGDFDGFHSYAG